MKINTDQLSRLRIIKINNIEKYRPGVIFYTGAVLFLGQNYPINNRSNCHTTIGDSMSRLKQLRKERGYTQVKMQMLTGIDQSDYSKLETGKRYYTYEQLRRIALALDTSMDYLAGLTDEKKPYPRQTQA